LGFPYPDETDVIMTKIRDQRLMILFRGRYACLAHHRGPEAL